MLACRYRALVRTVQRTTTLSYFTKRPRSARSTADNPSGVRTRLSSQTRANGYPLFSLIASNVRILFAICFGAMGWPAYNLSRSPASLTNSPGMPCVRKRAQR